MKHTLYESISGKKSLNSSKMILNFKNMMEEAFENIVKKEKNAGNQEFLLFPYCFLPF